MLFFGTSALSSFFFLLFFSLFFFFSFNVHFDEARCVLFLSYLKQRILLGEGRSGDNTCRLQKADKACLEEKVLQGLSFLIHICSGGGESGAAPNFLRFREGLLMKPKGSGMRDEDSRGGQILEQVSLLLIWQNPARQQHCKL